MAMFWRQGGGHDRWPASATVRLLWLSVFRSVLENNESTGQGLTVASSRSKDGGLPGKNRKEK
jgi:hypothetical protein